jgi:HEAT repeat protein
MTAAELRAQLSVIEPTETMYAGIAPTDVPALQQLIAQGEGWIAARAVFALSRVGTGEAVAAMASAVTDSRSPVRVAVAAAASQRPIVLPDTALVHLLRDKDVGVRKFAPQAVKPENGQEPRAELTRLAAEDAIPAIRQNAAEALRKFR